MVKSRGKVWGEGLFVAFEPAEWAGDDYFVELEGLS